MARPPARTGISPESEREFALRIAEGHDPAGAAKLAGFPSWVRPARAMRTAGFAEALQRAMRHRLSLLAPEAVKVLDGLMRNPDTPARVRADAAKAVLDRAGLPAGVGSTDQLEGKRPREVSTGELAALIERLEREKADRALAVDGSHEFPEPVDNCPPPDFME